MTDLDARGEVLTQLALGVEAREIDQPTDPGPLGGEAKAVGEGRIALGEVGLAVHGVQEVVGHVDIGERLIEAATTVGVALDHLDAVDPLAVGDPVRRAGEDPDGVTGVEEGGHETRADIAGRAGHQDAGHGLLRRVRCATSR